VLRHIGEVSGNISATCRYYGISPRCCYTWYRRFDDEGLRDRSNMPPHRPTKTDPEAIEKIRWPRAAIPLGPQKISMYLHRYHAIEISSSSIWCIHHTFGLGRLPTSQCYKRRHD